MSDGWQPDGAGGFIQRGSRWTHKASTAAEGFEFIATEHRGTDYVVPVPVDVVRALLRAWDDRHPPVAAPMPTTLWRPVGYAELELIERTAWRRFPPRLPDQSIFYPVCSERYAHEIAERWNAGSEGRGYVLRFAVQAKFLAAYDRKRVGASYHEEYWIPAADLEAFNDSIVGTIEVVARYGSP